MRSDTESAARFAGEGLDVMLQGAERDTTETIESADLPRVVTHFARLRDAVEDLASKLGRLQNIISTLSNETLPTMFGNANVKTIHVEGVGRVSIVVRWNARIADKTKAYEWLRATGNEALIIETVAAPTLTAFAREAALEGHPLPDDIFKVRTVPHVSITKV